jgi:hypothetical protein
MLIPSLWALFLIEPSLRFIAVAILFTGVLALERARDGAYGKIFMRRVRSIGIRDPELTGQSRKRGLARTLGANRFCPIGPAILRACE